MIDKIWKEQKGSKSQVDGGDGEGRQKLESDKQKQKARDANVDK